MADLCNTSMVNVHLVIGVLHRESKKQDKKLLAITLLIIIRFSIFFSLADSVVNLQQIHL